MDEGENEILARQRRRVLIIHNPVAGRRRRGFLDKILQALTDQGCAYQLRATNGRGDARSLAKEAAEEPWDLVVAAGGDGTVNEVANGLYGTEMPLAVIPMGTANVLAAEIGLPTGARDIAHLISSGPARPIHVGMVNERLFVMMVGVGFDAKVVAGVSSRIKRWIGKAAFVL
ncbi:MAG: NAD(+)/NADH kinase, partial [Rhodospirillales bacterium]|nr:NAD(+)/NADH kinase [Rhodospirillales bacterium]